MSKKYQDGFFHICNEILGCDTISIRKLAPFLEVPRSSIQDGLARIEENKELSHTAQKLFFRLVTEYYKVDTRSVSSFMSDEELAALYGLTAEDATVPDGQTNAPEELSLDDEDDDLGFSDDDDEMFIGDSLDSQSGVIGTNDRIIQERETILQEVKNGDIGITEYIVRLARQKQRLQDIAREERKVMREATRSVNLLEELNTEVIDLLKSRRATYKTKPRTISTHGTKGVIQLSDLHLGELVNETIANRFDMEVASKRLHKLAERAIAQFKSNGVESVAVFMTGDLINSTRRISEITAFAGPRVMVVFHAFLLIGQFLEMLYDEFAVTVAHVVGNESRLSEYFDTTNYLASDNFDLMVFEMLKQTHARPGMQFVDSGDNPMEQVVEVNGVNFLLVHGNGHSNMAATNKIESEVQKLKARYAEQDIKIGYVLCGHIHSTYIANGFARSASLVGSNAYAERTLNFTSRAAQNIFLVYSDATVDAMMVDLQEYSGFEGFEFDNSVMTHKTTALTAPTIHRMI